MKHEKEWSFGFIAAIIRQLQLWLVFERIVPSRGILEQDPLKNRAEHY